MTWEFLLHGQRAAVQNIQSIYVMENNRLLTMIENHTNHRTLVRQERRVRRLSGLLADHTSHTTSTADAHG